MVRRTAPLLVDHTRLVQPEREADAILVGSPAWFAWLTGATSFAFIGECGRFTAHKERRKTTREYWKAYRHRGGRLYRAYLGKSAELTLDRLNAVAAELAGGMVSALPTPDVVSLDRTQGKVQPITNFQLNAVQPGTPHSGLNPLDDPQTLHLLTTKLAVPMSRPNLVPRPRLVERLTTAIRQGQKLILISAPAGFGKTTLLVEWLTTARLEARDLRFEDPAQAPSHKSPVPHVAWLSLDDTDNHLGQFLAYLIAALETVRPYIGAEAWALLRAHAEQPPTQAILIVLLNALADPADALVLVLDDYHTITLQAIHEAMAFFLDRMPSQMYILMTTRADPPLSLARLRVRGALAEVRAADLRFTHDETMDLFDHLQGVRIPTDAVTALAVRTEGWAAGLQLATLSLQHQDAAQIATFLADFTGSHAYVFDYLADEVFQHQPEAVRAFLIQTAIPERLCGPLCAAVSAQDDAQMLLERLDQANLFLIRLDSQRHWYRYHQLFRDFLHKCLDRAVGSAGIALLHRRASTWFEQNGLAGEAVEHALSAQAWEDALRCLMPLMTDQRFYEYFLDWPRWVNAIPDRVLEADPDLCLRLARILILIGHIEVADRPLSLAEAVWRAAGNEPRLGELLGYRALVLALKRDFLHAIDLAQQALARIPDEAIEQRGAPAYALGYSALTLGQVGFATKVLAPAHLALQGSPNTLVGLAVAVGVARAIQLQGQLQRATVLYQDVIRRAAGATHQEQSAVYFYLGRLYYEWNDLEEAERALHQGILVGQRTGRGRFWPSAYAALAWVRWARGYATESISLMEQALASARALNSPPTIIEVETRQAGLWLAWGDLGAAVRWLSSHTLDIESDVPFKYQAEYLMLARIRITQQRQDPGSIDVDAVVRLLDRLLQAAEADERMSDRIAILVLLALAHAARGEPNQALASLASALALAEPEGYIRTFVDEGLAMRSLLFTQRAHLPDSESGARLRGYIDRLVDAFSPSVSAASPSSPPPALLSERERAILRLLADGRSIQEIATGLIISVHTARTHVKHIYAKLDAHNRVQALERARALQLL